MSMDDDEAYIIQYFKGEIYWGDESLLPKGLPKEINLKVVIVDGEVDDIIDEDLG